MIFCGVAHVVKDFYKIIFRVSHGSYGSSIRVIVEFDVCRFFGAAEITQHEKRNFSLEENVSFLAGQILE